VTPDIPAARLLLVDDNSVLTRLVCHQVESAGYGVVVAASAAEAWGCLAKESFDLLLLDVELPDQDGYALCRELKGRECFKELPVIFLTAHGSGAEVVKGFDAGGVDYVVKPFDLRVLLARIETHTALARLSRDLQAALDERTASLRQAHRRMRELDSEMALAEERERRRLADQLHDTAIQQLVLARILLDRIPEAPETLDRVKGLLDGALAQLRSLIFEISPPVLYQGGLGEALAWLADQLGARWAVRFRFRVEGVAVPLPEDIKVTLFQGARELMTNVGRHSGARHCEVVLSFGPDYLDLTVRDDGVGIGGRLGGAIAPQGGGGFGLFSLGSRIELIGGTLDLVRIQEGGTRAAVRIPWPPSAPDGATDPAGRATSRDPRFLH
jgi:signal transduction histidine kinase